MEKDSLQAAIAERENARKAFLGSTCRTKLAQMRDFRVGKKDAVDVPDSEKPKVLEDQKAFWGNIDAAQAKVTRLRRADRKRSLQSLQKSYSGKSVKELLPMLHTATEEWRKQSAVVKAIGAELRSQMRKEDLLKLTEGMSPEEREEFAQALAEANTAK